MVAALHCVRPQFQWYQLAYATEIKSIQLHDSIVRHSQKIVSFTLHYITLHYIDNQTLGDILQDSTRPLVEKSPPASYPLMDFGARFWWWDALTHQHRPAQIREETLGSGNLFSAVVEFLPPYIFPIK